MPEILKIATRKSPLALWQAEEVQRHLALAGVKSELVKMTTRGDQILDQPLATIGGKGLFSRSSSAACWTAVPIWPPTL